MACASSFRTSLSRYCSFFSKNPANSLPRKSFNSASGQPTPSSNSIKGIYNAIKRLRETLGGEAETSRPNSSRDGKRIAFESDRLRYAEIWACDGDGSNCGQLTSLKGVAGAARSPDGRYIAFEYRPKEHSEIYLLEVANGVPRMLITLPGADNGGPNWSRDGKWIYFYSDQGSASFQLWKTQLSGGSPVQVTKNGGVFAAESTDGRFLYYSKYESPGVWRMPLNGGEEIRVLDQQPAGEDWWNWGLTRSGIYFFDQPNHTTNRGVKIFGGPSG